jgi:hypothetical protein
VIQKISFVQVSNQHQERRGEELIYHRHNETERPTRGPDPCQKARALRVLDDHPEHSEQPLTGG